MPRADAGCVTACPATPVPMTSKIATSTMAVCDDLDASRCCTSEEADKTHTNAARDQRRLHVGFVRRGGYLSSSGIRVDCQLWERSRLEEVRRRPARA